MCNIWELDILVKWLWTSLSTTRKRDSIDSLVRSKCWDFVVCFTYCLFHNLRKFAVILNVDCFIFSFISAFRTMKVTCCTMWRDISRVPEWLQGRLAPAYCASSRWNEHFRNSLAHISLWPVSNMLQLWHITSSCRSRRRLHFAFFSSIQVTPPVCSALLCVPCVKVRPYMTS